MKEFRFSENITALCKIHNISVIELAEKTGISKNMIWYYKRGKNEPTLYNTARIADFFNITIDELCFDNLDGEK